MTPLSRDDLLVLAAVIVAAALIALRWSGLPLLYAVAAVNVAALLALAGWGIASAAADVARWARRAR